MNIFPHCLTKPLVFRMAAFIHSFSHPVFRSYFILQLSDEKLDESLGTRLGSSNAMMQITFPISLELQTALEEREIELEELSGLHQELETEAQQSSECVAFEGLVACLIGD